MDALDRDPVDAAREADQAPRAGENPDRLPELAADLVRLKVDVIIGSTPGVRAAQQAARNIPIIMCIADDAVKQASSPIWPGQAAISPEWLRWLWSWPQSGWSFSMRHMPTRNWPPARSASC